MAEQYDTQYDSVASENLQSSQQDNTYLSGYQGNSNNSVLNQREIEKTIRVAKRVIREEIIEDSYVVKETIVELAKPIIHEKIVEVPEVEYREIIKEVHEKVVEEKIKEIPKIEYHERIVEVPKYITQEKIVTVPQIEYRDIVTEKVVEIPEVRQNTVYRKVQVPKYVDDQGQEVAPPVQEVERKIPVPMEAVTTYEYQLAQFRPRVTKVQYPMYVPRFIPVPVPADQIESSTLAAMQEHAASIHKLVAPQAIGLHEVEELANETQALDYVGQLPTAEQTERIIREKWLTGQLQVTAVEQQQS